MILKRNGITKSNTDSLAALIIFCAFAFCVLFVLVLGAQVYSGFTGRDSETYTYDNLSLYFTTKFHRMPSADSAEISSVGDCQALFIRENLGGFDVVTCIYAYDGWLYELFVFDDGELNFDPQDGNRVLQAESAGFSIDEGAVTIDLVSGKGEKINIQYSLRGGGNEK